MTTALLAAILLIASAAALSAHDMFIKLDSYFLNPGDTLRVPILNGTFTTTENAIERERVLDLAVWGPNGLTHPAPLDWRASHDTTFFGLVLAKEGTYAAGVATKPRVLEMKGPAFNEYLKEEGLTDILERRKRLGQLNKPAKERYAQALHQGLPWKMIRQCRSWPSWLRAGTHWRATESPKTRILRALVRSPKAQRP